MTKLIHVVGARPNFMKTTPVWNAISKITEFDQIVVHTGQHYDKLMSDIFFKELQMPVPDYNFNIGSDTHASDAVFRFIPCLQRRKGDRK